jgi:phosphohistidine phosphatase
MKKVTLIIMRHAKSDWLTGEYDFDRPLAERGARDASRMGKWLSSSEYSPDQIIASPAVRAKQTVELLCKASGLDVDQVVWEKSIYSTDTQNLLDIAKNYLAMNKTVMLVGHNPAMEELLHYLSDADVPATHSGKYMTTANIAVFELNQDSKNFLHAGSGKSLVLARPKEIDI